MKHHTVILVAALLSLSLTGCADGGDMQTTDTSLALTEALDACLEDLRACRADAESDEATCRELMACLPERDEARTSESDWRTYCDGVEARCEDGVADEETCEMLRERCAGGDDARGACYRECVEAGGDEQTCRTDCYQDDGQAAQPEVTVEECMADCEGQGIDASLCGERCGML